MPTQITYQPEPAAPAPSDEAVRQVFSAVSLVRDRLSEVEGEHDYTPEQKAAFEQADELLSAAHRALKRALR